MPRLSSTRVFTLFEVAACMAGALTACLSGETIDLGANYARDARDAGLDSGSPPVAESGADAPTDAPDEEDAAALDAPVDAPEADAPPLSGAFVCIPDPSFENDPADDAAASGPLVTAPPQWQVCSSSAANPPICAPPPSDGSSYLGLSIGLAPLLFNPASVDATLCEPLEPGVTYLLSLDLALGAPDTDAAPPGEPPALQVRGSTTACDTQGDLLLRFSPATNTCAWKSACATFVARQAYSHLFLIPEATSSTGLAFSQTDLLVDNLRSEGTCQAPR